ncbi:MAG: hypothetical protein ACRDP3_21180 [Streptomyces sp.]|uniref:hypothetical protein n=1 Tax=Streptomyces sp. TaxID=1931 RepID=UPI003D6ADA8E
MQKGETVGQAGVRECREATGLDVEVVGLVGVFFTPHHVIVYLHGDRIDEVRQPINTYLPVPDSRPAPDARRFGGGLLWWDASHGLSCAVPAGVRCPARARLRRRREPGAG